ncbi:universal stress protein [Pseudorhodoferax sp.]|uniref:universal stress protein n=1 Tax=Pseudorhodoferax sp. TaxID=1993553 RepID=UPI002DD66650|nr:universal stress protein [Pseudorhodoferax sp.]
MNAIVAGFTPDAGGHEALALGAMLANARKAKLLVTVVVPQSWGYPVQGSLDGEYAKFLDEHATKTLDEARQILAGMSNVEYLRSTAASATEGLVEIAHAHGAECIAIGSASGGSVGRLFMGGVSEEIMHACDLPVVMAPREFKVAPDAPLRRVTVAYAGAASSERSVLEALGFAARMGVPLRLASFAVRDRSMFPTAGMGSSEEEVISRWRDEAAQSLERVRALLVSAGTTLQLETAVSAAASWDAAMSGIDWFNEELLVLGSSKLGIIKRVFLGSTAHRILRASPVPVMALPRMA